MRKNKKALSGIVTTLIIILLVLVAIGLLWNVIKGFIEGGMNEIEVSQVCMGLSVQIQGVAFNSSVNDSSYDVTLKRNSGGDSDVEVNAKIIFSKEGDSSNVIDWDNETSLEPLEIKTKTFDLTTITDKQFDTIGNATKVEVTPYFLDIKTQKQHLCDTGKDEYVIVDLA